MNAKPIDTYNLIAFSTFSYGLSFYTIYANASSAHVMTDWSMDDLCHRGGDSHQLLIQRQWDSACSLVQDTTSYHEPRAVYNYYGIVY